MIYTIVDEKVYKTKELSFLDKLIFERITALCHINKCCYATNSYFANMYGVKNNAISVAIKKLKDLKLINVKYEKDIPNRSKRYIFLNDDVWSKEYSNIIPRDNKKVIPRDRHNNNYKNNINNKIIDYDTDGVMLWNGVRCESKNATLEEQEEMKKFIHSCIGESND